MNLPSFKQFILKQPEILYEFANLDYRRTGIEDIVIHCYSQGNTKIQHGARVKVSNVYGKFSNSDNFVIEVKTGSIVEGECKLSQKELKIIKLWISLNRQQLIEYWNSQGQMTTDDFLDSIKKVN